LFVISGAALPASVQATVLILEPNLTITVGQGIGFSPEFGNAAISTVPTGDSFGLGFYSSNSNKPILGTAGSGQFSYSLVDPGSGQWDRVDNFAVGTFVGPSSSWLGVSTFAYLDKPAVTSQFPAGTRGFVGLRTPNGADWNYSWADVSYNADRSLTLNAVAFETQTNAPIQTFQVPESKPGIAAALVAGSLVAWRARQMHRRHRNRASSPVVVTV
jgi:hypothetical protein